MFDWLTHIPLWLLGMLLFVAMLAAAWLGYTLRRQIEARDPGFAKERNDTQEGYIVSAVLALLGLLIGFTFALVIDRYEARRLLVVEEANAIGTLYLRAQLLDEPHRARFSGLLSRYVDNHIELAKVDPLEGNQLLRDNERLLTDLWAATIPAFDTIRGIDFSSTFVDSVNHVIDLDAARKAARVAQIPSAVFALLFVYAIVTAMTVSYVLVGKRGRLAGLTLLVLFTLSLMLLSDINRPVTGMIRESQMPIEALRRMMRENPPAAFDAPPPAPNPPLPGPPLANPLSPRSS